jgi:K+-transporting ATPase, c chain
MTLNGWLQILLFFAIIFVAAHTDARQFGFLGELRVNVLELNLDLDQKDQ